MPLHLSASQISDFHRDGLLVLPGFASDDACHALMARALALVDGFEPASLPSVFSSVDQARTTDDYFMESGAQIRFFLEEGALGPDGRLDRAKQFAVNKIGHALHDRDPVFDAFSRDARLAGIVADLGVASPRLMQSMYIFKQPQIGGEVVCHQDATYLHTEPVSVMGLWFALQDATRENGCMWALPGGHYVPLEAKRGTLIVLHGLLPHLSGANLSPRSRHAYTLHVVDGAARYSPDNWLQRPASDPARGF
jgi:phytanoyl-CoA hydroxylase